MRNKVILIVFFIIFLFPYQVFAQTELIIGQNNEEWKIIESKCCTIHCHPEVDIKKVNNKIKIRFYDINCGRFSARTGDAEKKLADKFDCIFQKVQKILDMYPRRINLSVKIYKNQSQLDEAYKEIFGEKNERNFISFYVHKYVTIHTTESAIRQGVIAHEIGHAVTDHYFLILPPEKIKELLSQYVESHLED